MNAVHMTRPELVLFGRALVSCIAANDGRLPDDHALRGEVALLSPYCKGELDMFVEGARFSAELCAKAAAPAPEPDLAGEELREEVERVFPAAPSIPTPASFAPPATPPVWIDRRDLLAIGKAALAAVLFWTIFYAGVGLFGGDR